MRMGRGLACAVLSLLVGGASGGLVAQSSLIDPGRVSLSPSALQWTFSEPLAVDTLHVAEASQLSAPIAVSFTPLRDWRVEFTGAYTLGRVIARDPATGEDYSLVLHGLTDARLRTVGRLIRDRFWLTAGVNVPAGRTGLDSDQTAAIRVLGAPALRMPTPALGSGAGFIVGPVVTARWAGWAVGLGASFELRSAYTPVEATLGAAQNTVVDLDPGEAIHVSLGLDRIVGQGKLSVVFAADRYTQDRITVTTGGGPTVEAAYRLGPTVEARGQYRVTTPALRDFRIDARVRRRSEFFDGSGSRVRGSGGSYVDLGVAAAFGAAGSTSVVVEGVFSRDSGIGVDDTLATAAMTGASVLVGVEVPFGRVRLVPHVRAGAASIDTGPETASGRLLGVGLTVRSSW